MPDSVSVQQSIAAAPEAVTALISDVTRMGEWSPETTAGTWSKGATGPAVGARFKGDNVNESKRWSTTCTVTAYEPGKVFTFRVNVGPVKVADWSYTLEATDDGCVVTESWTDLRSGLSKKLGGLASGVTDRDTHNRAGMIATLEALRAAAEV